MPTFMLVPQTERFCLNIDLICRATWAFVFVDVGYLKVIP